MQVLHNNLENNNSLMRQEFRVIKSDSGLFWVSDGNEVKKCTARSRLKKNALIVGDFVTLTDCGEFVVDSVLPRRNRLIRPSVANIDQMIIMVAAIPEIDYLLLDKLIINAHSQDIETVICVNKSDIGLDNWETIRAEYSKSVSKIISASAIEGEVLAVRELLGGKLTCFAGQSAVGKSTIVNVLLGRDRQKIGELSQKISRGKNTTTSSEIFEVDGGFVVDTPGFSVVDIKDVQPMEISHFYAEFDQFRKDCKFSTCTHTQEPCCGVKLAASQGKISPARLKRYQRIYLEHFLATKRQY